MSQPPIHHWTPTTATATAPEPNQPVTYRTPRQLRAAAAREGVSIAHGSTPTDAEMRALIDAAKIRTVALQIAIADPDTPVTIEVRRRFPAASLREYRTSARRAPNLIRHFTRLSGVVGVRVRVDNGLWFDVPLHHSSSITAA